MGILLLISDLKNTPPAYILPKVIHILYQRIKSLINRINDLKSGTYSTNKYTSVSGFLSSSDFTKFESDKVLSGFLESKFLKNQFDVFGSGYIDWSVSQIKNLNREFLKENINQSNVKNSLIILEELEKIDPEYRPVNWQLDGKSMYQFSSNIHYTKISKHSLPDGADIKVPWELGRLHHLTTLLPSLLDKNIESSTDLIKKVKCHILDFILSNPPSFGVQWTSAMDVSIRLLNLCIVTDVLRQIDKNMEGSAFFSILLNSINDHIQFAWKLREHKNGLSNNHYLANLVGLMYGCYFLNSSESGEILRRCIRDFWKEADKQFLNDGGNFESSTTYHVFSTEIVALGLALCQRMHIKNLIPFEKQVNIELKDLVLKKIFRASKMIEAIEISDGFIPQVGDNDSARMVYFTFQYEPTINQTELNKSDTNNSTNVISRNLLKYKSSIEIISSCFGNHGFDSIHSLFIKSIMDDHYKIKDHKQITDVKYPYSVEKLQYKTQIKYPEGEGFAKDLTLNLKMYVFDEFGIYVFKGENIYLLVNGTNRHVKQYWPHGHNDKLSFELWIDGNPVIRDPGSYTYTANPQKRNEYRSVHAHAVIIFNNEEQNVFLPGRQGVFRMIPGSRVRLLQLDRYSVTLELEYAGYHQIREFIIRNNFLEVNDFANFAFEVNKYPKTAFSKGYGVLEN